MWQETCDTWQVTHDTWHVTHSVGSTCNGNSSSPHKCIIICLFCWFLGEEFFPNITRLVHWNFRHAVLKLRFWSFGAIYSISAVFITWKRKNYAHYTLFRPKNDGKRAKIGCFSYLMAPGDPSLALVCQWLPCPGWASGQTWFTGFPFSRKNLFLKKFKK